MAIYVPQNVGILSSRVQSIVLWVAYMFRVSRRDGKVEISGKGAAEFATNSRKDRPSQRKDRGHGPGLKDLEKEGDEKGEVKSFEEPHCGRYGGNVTSRLRMAREDISTV